MIYWQSNGKAKIFSCVLLGLEMLRQFRVLSFERAGLLPCVDTVVAYEIANRRVV